MAEPNRVIATVTSYDEFVAAIRRWITELGTNYESVGEIAGLQSGYLGTLLASTPVRSFSRMSLGSTLSALGLRLQLVVDAEQLERLRHRYTARSVMGRKLAGDAVSGVHSHQKPVKPRFSLIRGNPELARMLHARWMLQSSRRTRRRIARAAARERWANRREGEAAQRDGA
jgi:hypothetical protein